jgi:hypothetical protein
VGGSQGVRPNELQEARSGKACRSRVAPLPLLHVLSLYGCVAGGRGEMEPNGEVNLLAPSERLGVWVDMVREARRASDALQGGSGGSSAGGASKAGGRSGGGSSWGCAAAAMGEPDSNGSSPGLRDTSPCEALAPHCGGGIHCTAAECTMAC